MLLLFACLSTGAVVEQIAGFKYTEYSADCRADPSVELDFETKLLTYDRRGGFTLPLVNEQGVLQEDLLQIWLRRMETLGGPKLLERGPSTSSEGGDPDGPTSVAAKPSFASDRRVIRLIIARIFADMLQEKYLAAQGELS